MKVELKSESSEVSLSSKDLLHEEPKLTLLGNIRNSFPFPSKILLWLLIELFNWRVEGFTS